MPKARLLSVESDGPTTAPIPELTFPLPTIQELHPALQGNTFPTRGRCRRLSPLPSPILRISLVASGGNAMTWLTEIMEISQMLLQVDDGVS